MTIYAVLTPDNDEKLATAAEEHFPGKVYKVAPGQFLISTPIATTKVSETLGAPAGSIGKILVVRVANYTGWHSKDMWEWLAEQSKPPEPPMEPSRKTDDE